MGILSKLFTRTKAKETDGEQTEAAVEKVAVQVSPMSSLEQAREIGKRIYDGLKRELSDPATGKRYREIITTDSPLSDIMPKDKADKLSLMVAEQRIDGLRPESIIQDIAPLVPEIDKDTLLPYIRTCNAVASTALTQVRCEKTGLPMYEWHSVRDERTDPAHRAMNGVLCLWEEKPNPNVALGKSGGKCFHPGGALGCRCSAFPVTRIQNVKYPARCYYHGEIRIANTHEELIRIYYPDE